MGTRACAAVLAPLRRAGVRAYPDPRASQELLSRAIIGGPHLRGVTPARMGARSRFPDKFPKFNQIGHMKGEQRALRPGSFVRVREGDIDVVARDIYSYRE